MPSQPHPPSPSSAQERLRQCWQQFRDLAKSEIPDADSQQGNVLIARHKAAIEELADRREIPRWMAEFIQETYEGAIQHLWRSRSTLMCYRMSEPVVSLATRELLVQQVRVLEEVAAEGTIDPATLAKVQSALERDLTKLVLSPEEIEALNEQVREEIKPKGRDRESLEEWYLQRTENFAKRVRQKTLKPQAAAQFILELLTGK